MAPAATATVKAIRRDASFAWEGRDKRGHRIKGKSLAPDESALRMELRKQGIAPSRIRKQAQSMRGGKVNAADISIFARQLATMLASGIPMVQAFEIVGSGSEKPALQKLILDVKGDIEAGSSLHEALSKHPLYFDDLFVNLVEAGEQAGALETLLDKIATYKEKSEAMKKKVKKALFYPAAVVAVAFLVTIILLIFVIPEFQKLFQGFGANLPAFTMMVINISEIVQHQGIYLAIVAGAAVWTFLYFKKRSRKMRTVLDRIMLKFPIIGPIINKAAIARYARTLSTMFAAGVPLVEALESVAGACGNIVYEDAVMKMKDEVATGQRLQRAMEARGIFPNMVVQMIAVGEESGSLDTMSAKVATFYEAEVATGQRLQRAMEARGIFPNMVVQMIAVGEESGSLDTMSGKVATFYEAEVDNAVDAMSSLLEPLIMVVLGVIVGGLVIAMYLPIFKMGQVV